MKIVRWIAAALGLKGGSKTVEVSVLDEQMVEVAAFFSGKIKGDSDVLLAEHLDRSRLDFSLDSLHAVDAWLAHLLEAKVDPSSEASAESIIWAGAYVGEVIRACAKRSYSWKRYKDFMQSQPESLKNVLPYTFGTQFLLATPPRGMTLPINKVIRFLDEGPENNLHFYASAECRR